MGDFFLLENYLNEDEAKKLFDYCKEKLPWERFPVKIYGKTVLQPRLSCMLGHTYTYSGFERKVEEVEFPKRFKKLIEKLDATSRDFYPDHDTFNGCLCNYYRDGSDYIGPHSDDENQLVPGAFIASISLGASRHFDIIYKASKKKVRLELTNGSLLLMGKNSQKLYQHSVPVEKKIKEPRINLTFRCFK